VNKRIPADPGFLQAEFFSFTLKFFSAGCQKFIHMSGGIQVATCLSFQNNFITIKIKEVIMMLNKRQSRNGQDQMPGVRSQVNSDVTPTFSTLPSLMDEFFFNDPFFKWGNNWMTGHQSGKSLGTTLPAVNIRETADDFILEVAAPGMNKKDFKVECVDNQLHIAYRHNEEKTQGEPNSDYWRREFNFESFDRSFQPDTVNSEKVLAKYEDGILKITVAKREEARKKPARKFR
jgi:HSP20 family protein